MVRLRSTQNYACNRHPMDERIVKYCIAKSLYKLISLCNWIRFKIGFIYCCSTICKWMLDTCRILSFIIAYLPFCCINTDRIEFSANFLLLYCIPICFFSPCNSTTHGRSIFFSFWDVNRFRDLQRSLQTMKTSFHRFALKLGEWKNNVLMPLRDREFVMRACDIERTIWRICVTSRNYSEERIVFKSGKILTIITMNRLWKLRQRISFYPTIIITYLFMGVNTI